MHDITERFLSTVRRVYGQRYTPYGVHYVSHKLAASGKSTRGLFLFRLSQLPEVHLFLLASQFLRRGVDERQIRSRIPSLVKQKRMLQDRMLSTQFFAKE